MVMKKTPLWFKGLLLLLVCGMVFSAIQLQGKTGQQQIVENFFLALRNNQTTKAYYANTSDSFQEKLSLKEFKDILEAHPLLESDLFLHLVIDGKTVQVSLDDQLKVSFDLIQEEGEWKINAIEIL